MVERGRSDTARTPAPPDPETAAVRQAATLSRAPALFAENGDGTMRPLDLSPSGVSPAVHPAYAVHYDRSMVEAAAKRISATIPFPPRLNSASHLDWDMVIDRGLGGSTIPDYELQRIVQAHALRDWAWYATNHELTAEQRAVIETATSWSAYRGGRGGTARLAQQAMKLGPTAEGRAFSARFFIESNGVPLPSRW